MDEPPDLRHSSQGMAPTGMLLGAALRFEPGLTDEGIELRQTELKMDGPWGGGRQLFTLPL